MARFDDLGFDRPPTIQEEDRDRRHEQEIEGFLSEIAQLQETHSFAADTLEGIYETIERTRQISPGQRRAIENIAASRGRSSSRRYR